MSPTTIATVNPATGETVRTFVPHDDAEIERRLQRAADAFPKWRRTSVAARGARSSSVFARVVCSRAKARSTG